MELAQGNAASADSSVSGMNIMGLRARGLVKSFRARKVVKGVSIEVLAGEVVGLLGPNGAGKTTIFDMIVGLGQPDEGKIGRASCRERV